MTGRSGPHRLLFFSGRVKSDLEDAGQNPIVKESETNGDVVQV
jgi:hypothetical protein